MILERGVYACDAGSLKIGNEGFSVLISNGVGDGEFNWAVTTDMPTDMDLQMCVQGERLFIYDYDCKGGEPICGPLTGSFMVYSRDGDVCLHKISDKPDWWGNNHPEGDVK